MNLLAETCAAPSLAKIFLQSMAYFVPSQIQEFLYDHLPGKGLDKARANKRAAHKVACELVENKIRDLSVEKTGRDVLSILVKVNASENERTSLTEDEMISQMRTIMAAG
ncbi:hypothetical protein OBBRIDRAFT_666891 [Obba rivulosa]|uniref:Uncharacterized protein n=1 Tax=Obba rivulosa TaxID=1052685 RepID=A0A8E2AWI7_9APHY|nr:hypothetical protein OBBRIDRAFT_666891 [Obba rivulosa]